MKYFAILCSLLISLSSHAQEMKWETLDVPLASDRYNDVWFVDPLNGWAIIPEDGGFDSRVFHTTDGGLSWTVQLELDNHVRSITFLDKQRGFVGVLFGDIVSPLYSTTDGGSTWDTVDTFVGPVPKGLCGMMAVDSTTAVGIGRIFGPACFIRTTDAGQTWHSQELPSAIKSGIDCYFWSADSGIVVGGTTSTSQGSNTIILGTTDGGQTWEERFRGTDSPEWCWKISFPSPDHGFVAVEDFSEESNLLVTSDRGRTWDERTIIPTPYSFQGIGFITDSIGWAGGRTATFMTTDAGITWNPTDSPRKVNRFRFFGDTLGYAAGEQLYRLRRQSSKLQVESIEHPENPVRFDFKTQQLTIESGIEGQLVIYDLTGRTLLSFPSIVGPSGLSLKELPSGIYLCNIFADKNIFFKVLKP